MGCFVVVAGTATNWGIVPARQPVIKPMSRLQSDDDITGVQSGGLGPTAGLHKDDDETMIGLEMELRGDFRVKVAQLQAPLIPSRGP
jgi:hypothetical protein